MVLESLREGAPVNIKDLVIDFPRKDSGWLFDPDRDISGSDLKELDNKAKAVFNEQSIPKQLDPISICSSLRLLFPNRKLPIDFSDRRNFEYINSVSGLPDRGFEAFSVAIINPQVQIKDYGYDSLTRIRLRASEVRKEWDGIHGMDYRMLAGLKLCSAEGIEQILSDKGLKEKLLRVIENFTVDGQWYRYANNAACARIVLEDDFDMVIPKEYWQKMQEELGDLRAKDNWNSFAIMARNMYILAAEKVRVTPEEGLILTMPKPKPDFRQQIPPLPQMRRF